MRGRLQCYMWVGMVILGHRSSKSTFGANNMDDDDDDDDDDLRDDYCE